MCIVGSIIEWVLWIFLLILFARMILSWVPVLVRDWEPQGADAGGRRDHLLRSPIRRCELLRKVLRPVRVGNMMLDLAFIGLAILVSILMQVNAQHLLRARSAVTTAARLSRD